MDKNSKQAVKQLLQSGALKLLEEVAQEIKSEMNPPEFKGSADGLLYETGRHVGRIEGLEIFFEHLTSLADV